MPERSIGAIIDLMNCMYSLLVTMSSSLRSKVLKKVETLINSSSSSWKTLISPYLKRDIISASNPAPSSYLTSPLSEHWLR